MKRLLPFIVLLSCMPPASADPPKQFEKLGNCTIISTEWADGDSFRIKTAMDKELTIRLYGADCMEWHVSDDTDARRLRAQRRYFGITSAKPVPQDAIEWPRDLARLPRKKQRIF